MKTNCTVTVIMSSDVLQPNEIGFCLGETPVLKIVKGEKTDSLIPPTHPLNIAGFRMELPTGDDIDKQMNAAAEFLSRHSAALGSIREKVSSISVHVDISSNEDVNMRLGGSALLEFANKDIEIGLNIMRE